MPAPRWLYVGRIAGPFGVHGELRAVLDTEFPDHLSDRRVYLGEEHRSVTVEHVRAHGRDTLLKLAAVDTVGAADALRGQALYIATEDAVPLPEGRYYVHQIVGLEVWTTNGDRYGVVLSGETPHRENMLAWGRIRARAGPGAPVELFQIHDQRLMESEYK